MTLGAVDLLFNMVVILFWLRAWENNRRLALFNPYLSGVENFTQPLLDFLTRGTPLQSQRAAAVLCGLILIVFRGVALPMTNPETIREIWQVRLGFEVVAPGQYAAWPALSFIVFSFLSFMVFIFQIWGIAMLYNRVNAPERPAEFIRALSGPMNAWPFRKKLISVLVLGVVLVLALNLAADNVIRIGSSAESSNGLRPGVWVLRSGVAALAGVVDLLMVIQSMMIILIIGSWIAMFTGGGALMIISREWLDFLLGPFRRFRIQIGILDLTPIIAFFALGVTHYIINGYFLRILYILIRSS